MLKYIPTERGCFYLKQNVVNLDNEVWVQLLYYDGRYYASNKGRIKSTLSNNKEFILKPRKTNSGYMVVGIYCEPYKCRDMYIHRLIAEAFLDNPNCYEMVNHKDGNKHNNNLDNLEWCSRSMNENHAYQNGLKTQVHRQKPILQFNKSGKFIAEYKDIRECTNKTGINYRNIWCVCNNKPYRHTAGGYVFKYKFDNGDKR